MLSPTHLDTRIIEAVKTPFNDAFMKNGTSLPQVWNEIGSFNTRFEAEGLGLH